MQNAVLNKIAGFPKQDTGVGWYRIIQPLRAMKREGLATDARIIPFSGDTSMQKMQFNDRTFMDVTKDADALITTVIFEDAELLKILNLRKWSGCKWIVDIDDNYYAVPRDNPSYNAALQLRENLDRCLSLADGVIVSVPTLRDLYAHLNKNIYVQKNGMDFTPWKEGIDFAWPKPLHAVRTTIRIGWEGASGHQDDLELVYPALRKIQEAYPQVQLVAFGHKPSHLNWEWHDWVGFMDYPQAWMNLDLDIVIAPLLDTSYNRCKSNLRLLDAAIMELPIVYTPTVNYRGFPGITATNSREWYEGLRALIEDKQHRKALGKNAYSFANKNYNIKNMVDGLATWIAALPRRTDY